MTKIRVFYLVFVTILSVPGVANAIEESFSCPAKIDLSTVSTKTPLGWSVYSKDRNYFKTTSINSAGTFHAIALHDGTPDETLGSLIPDNDDQGNSARFWFWNLRGLGEIYVGCDYFGTNIWLIRKIENRAIQSCRANITDGDKFLLTCN